MTSAATLWRTVRHLRAEQLIARIQFRLTRPTPDLRSAPARRAWHGAWVLPAAGAATLAGPRRLRVLNEDYDLERQGWDDPAASKLLRYNVHYFADLVAGDARARVTEHRALLESWIDANPPGTGTGWEPYPVSLRLVNWIKWFQAGNTPTTRWLQSIAIQARWLSRRLEYHLLGNHLLVNAKALVFAGAYFEGPEAEDWLASGMRILEREIPEQILADGAQFELSPMYHALALEDVLDLMNLCRAAESAAPRLAPLHAMLTARVAGMLRWLRAMTHPDGTPGLFNDCAPGIAPPLAELEAYAARLEVAGGAARAAVEHMAASGYVRADWSSASALIDVARVGPDYLPGHAHADTLSFELSLRGSRVLVNGGTSRYGLGPERLRERGTAAHSTVELAGQNSSEVWSGFRVGRRARPLGVEVGADLVAAAHDGYRFLAGRPMHRRTWRFLPASLLVEDEVGPGSHAAIARYHLAPGLSLTQTSRGCWRVSKGAEQVCDVEVLHGEANPEPSRHAAAFGITVPTACLALRLLEGRGSTRWTWTNHAHTVSH